MTAFTVIHHGTITGIRPLTDEARQWLDAAAQYESWQWRDGVLYVETNIAQPLLEALRTRF